MPSEARHCDSTLTDGATAGAETAELANAVQTPTQRHLWRDYQIHPKSCRNHVSLALTLDGPLNVSVLDIAVRHLFWTHDALRSSFDTRDGVDVKTVGPQSQSSGLRVSDITEQSLPAALENHIFTPFDLRHGPAWRAMAFRLTPEKHILHFVAHRIAVDRSSLGILQRDLATLYTSLCNEQNAPLRFTGQSEEAAASEAEKQNTRNLKTQLEFWIQKLGDSKPAEVWPDRVRPTILPGTTREEHTCIQGEMYESLLNFAKHHDQDLGNMFFAALRAAHFRLTGEHDANIAYSSQRLRLGQGTNPVGSFDTIQCLRLALEDYSFNELVEDVKKQRMEASANSDIDLSQIASELKREGDASRNALAQMFFAYHKYEDGSSLLFHDIKVSSYADNAASPFDLEVHCYEQAHGINIQVRYAEALFHKQAMSNLLSVLVKVLTAGVADIQAPIAELPLFCDGDSRQLMELNMFPEPYDETLPSPSVIEMFKVQVALHADDIAVSDPSQRLTYKELDHGSDTIARWLSTRGAPAEALVGLFATRSCEAIMAMLGILKAGMAYIPLDVRTPTLRLKLMTSALSDPKLVLAGRDILVPEGMADIVNFVQIPTIVSSVEYDIAPEVVTTAKHGGSSLAYVMFTSGSTGQPKGVMIEHGGIVRLAMNNRLNGKLPSRPIMSHLSNLAFDGSTWEIYSSLLNGGTVVCIDDTTISDPQLAEQTLCRANIDTAFFTPALFGQYLRAMPKQLSTFKAIMIAGARLDVHDVSEFRKMMTGNLINGYGPTENTGCSTMCCFEPGSQIECPSNVPIGYPISKSGAYVVDSNLRLVPLGVVGELVVTGAGLARGYTDPSRDNGVFVTIDINEQRVRAYRTGDRARYRPVDGLLEFLGRIDDQIKVRGQRVELGEIENVMLSHPRVKNAAICLEQKGSDNLLRGFACVNSEELHAEMLSEDSDARKDQETQHIDMWEEMYDADAHQQLINVPQDDVGRDFVGWLSMYDQQPIAKHEMDEWLDDTIATICRNGNPKHVLEIGCGSGMILFNLPEDLETYVGIDPAINSVNHVRNSLKSAKRIAGKARVLQGSAMDVAHLPHHLMPDTTIIVNSVTQLFPSQEYLLDFIRTVVDQLHETSTLFFGDLRSLPLHREFLAAKAKVIQGNNASLQLLYNNMKDAEERELELLVDPAFFTSLVDSFPSQVAHVEILPKKMVATNELSCFRYSAVVHLARKQERNNFIIQDMPTELCINFAQEHLGSGTLLGILRAEGTPSEVAIENIPYRKIAAERSIVKAIDQVVDIDGSFSPDYKEELALHEATNMSESLSPVDLLEIAEQAGYSVEISWAKQYSQHGAFDAVFHKSDVATPPFRYFRFSTDHAGRPPQTFTNRPWLQRMKQSIRDELYKTMQSRLPQYMIPSSLKVLAKFPITRNGKIDKRSLIRMYPASDKSSRRHFRPPISPLQKQMQQIWGKVLKMDVDSIGLDDSFFELGGNSISAMQIVSEAKLIGQRVSMANILRQPTLECVAANTEATMASSDVIVPFSLLPMGLEKKDILRDLAEKYQIPQEAVVDVYPCTPLQRGLVFLAFKEPGDYLIQFPIKIPPQLSNEVVERAWSELVKATPILRTRIVPYGSDVLQVVLSEQEQITWSRPNSLEEYLENDRHEPIEFGKALTRFALVDSGIGSERWLVWTLHHALFDAWSTPIMMDTVNNIISSRELSRQAPFVSFVKYIKNIDAIEAYNYWKDYLENSDDYNIFPTLPSSLTTPRTDTIIEHQLSGVHLPLGDVTASSVIRAAWALVIGQASQSKDVIFGSTLFGRNAPVADIESIVGPTFGTVPVRVELHSQQTVKQLLQDIHDQAMKMIPFEQTGLDQIAKVSESCNQACSFQTLLVVQAYNKARSESESRHFTVDWKSNESHQVQYLNPYALLLEVDISGLNFVAKASFDSRIVSADQVQSLLEQMELVVGQITSNDLEQKVGQVKLLTNKHLNQLWQWNQSVPATFDRLLHQMIQERIEAHPNSPAIHAWDGDFTYGELGKLSTVLATKLSGLGVVPDMMIPLCFEKSKWTPVAMLAVLKARGAFVLLDPSVPESRLRKITSQLETNFILSSQANMTFSSRLMQTAIEISDMTLNTSLDETSKFNVLPQSPSTAAFAVFTSGSTGTPKGVVMTHSQFASLLIHQSPSIGYEKASRVFDFASYSFDVAVYNFAASLVNGACLCIPSEADRTNNISGVMASMRVDMANLTPSVARLLDPEILPKFKTLLMGGEATSHEDEDKWAGSGTQLINGYGPAECTVATINDCSDSLNGIVGIGKGCGVVTWIVDPQNHNILLPPGCVGELLLEGPLLSRGYLNDEEKTAAAFIHDPPWLLGGAPGFVAGRQGRLYKTNDLARYDENGSLLFIGRKDSQVKIRGQRVELGEVEYHVLKSISGTSRVAVEVVAVNGTSKKSLLVACLEIEQGSPSEEETFTSISTFEPTLDSRASLQENLPRYMVPDAFFQIHKLPESRTGKIDRRKLHDMIRQHWSDAPHHEADNSTKRLPSTNTECKISDLWRSILDITDHSVIIGQDDSFFSLGGNSIDAMRAVGEAHQLDLHFTVADIFLYPTLSRLAEHVDSKTTTSVKTTIQPQGLVEAEQSFAQTRLWFLEQLHVGLGWYTMPFAIRLHGLLQLSCLEAALDAVEERHDTLRTVFFTESSINKQRVLPFKKRPLRIFDGTAAEDEGDLRRVLYTEQSTPFDLAKEPGWRICLYRLGDDHHVLSIVMHHIISDGWSIDVLRRELSTFYSTAVASKTCLTKPLAPKLSLQYIDYSIWQQSETDKGAHKPGLKYWLQHLEGSRPAEFMCDKPRPARLSGTADVQCFEIRGILYTRMQRFCKENDITYFAALLAAFRAAHYRLTLSRDATIGCPNANRDRWEVKELIGFFVNLLCVRLKIPEETSFIDLVRQVHSVVSKSFEHQDVPFEHIVSNLQHSRDISRNPLAQVSFTLNSQKDLGRFKFDGLDAEPLEVENKTRFDLEFHLFQETDGLSGSVVYSTELFEPTTVQTIISTFLRVLDSGIAEADTSIDLLPLVQPGDAPLSYLPHLEVNNTTDYPRDSSIVDIFREQVKQHASKIAVCDAVSSLSYSQLDEMSDNVAAGLQQLSLGRNAIVAMYTVRSCESTVATMGILKAGLAYLPFDISTPALRMEAMLDSLNQVSLVLIGNSLELPPIHNKVQSILIKDVMKPLPKRDTNGRSEEDFVTPGPTSLAHVLFTSGSTGKPKGVMIEHRGVVRLVKNSNATHHDPQTATLAHITSLAFDISTWEIFVTLLNGGTLVCISASDLLEPQRMVEIFRRENVQAVFMTPRLIEQYLAAQPEIFKNFTTVYSGGDFLTPAAVKTIQSYIGTGMINVSGPTENTVISTSYRIPLDCPCVNGVPIGPSMSNTGTYVMDALQRCVPHGVLGELVVTGDGLARGYVDANANKTFVTIQIEGRKMRAYRTGDLVRCRPSDRLFEIFGRMDNQIKLRGHRIETSEIEQLMLANNSVNEAGVVLAKADGDAEQSILAFIALQNKTMNEATPEPQEGSNKQPTKETEHVEFWGESFDKDTYNNISDVVNPDRVGRDYNGWVSMYDGAQIPEAEMDEWLDDTIATIVNGKRDLDVLELGSGTGMVLFSMASHLHSYFGVDPSQNVVKFLNDKVSTMPNLIGKVSVRCGTALDLSAFRQSISPKIVVVNSVAQYFPSQHYLLQVIQHAISLESVTTIVFGDMRSYALYSQFQVTKATRRLGTRGISRYQLQTEMRKTVQSEDELLVDPAFFTSLVQMEQLEGAIEHVEILPKRMKAVNELSCYRYAAVLHIKHTDKTPLAVIDVPSNAWIDYTTSLGCRDELSRTLEEHGSTRAFVAVENIPNSNISWENRLLYCLKSHRDPQHNWGACTDAANFESSDLSIVEICDMAHRLGYSVEFSSARQLSHAGGIDAIFHKMNPLSQDGRTLFKFPFELTRPHTLCHDPLLPVRILKVKSELNERLRARLPAYMMPQNIHVIEKMPLNANGKLDRAELSLLATSLCGTIQDKRAFRQPTSDKQTQMQNLWAETLHREAATISTDDNFFLLGGNSLTAMSLVSKGRLHGISLSVVDIFKQPTIESLVSAVAYQEMPSGTSPPIRPFSLLPMETDIESFVTSIKQEYSLVDDIEDIYPCTPLQEGLLALTTKRPGDYVSQDVIDLAPSVCIATFKKAWGKVVEAIPVLRTRIVRDSVMGLLQVVTKSSICWTESDRIAPCLELDEKKQMTLGLPLVRFALVGNSSKNSAQFIWTIHHSIYDGHSAQMILRAFEQAYRGMSIKPGPPFSTFIQHIGQQDARKTRDYWEQTLGDFQGEHFPRENAKISEPVSDTTLQATFQLPQRHQSAITAANMLCAAWALAAGQMTDSQDVCFGMTVNGRNAPIDGIEDMIAPTFATVPVRVKWDRNMKAIDYANMVQAQSADMIPFEQAGLRKISSLSTGCRQACQFQTLIVIQSRTQADKSHDHDAVLQLSETSDEQKFRFNPYALMLEVSMAEKDFTIQATFNSQIINAKEVDAILARLPQTMGQLAIASSETRIADLDLVSNQDADTIWNWNKSCPQAINGSVHARFREIASSQPGRPAIDAWDGTLTYAELDNVSDQLAPILMNHDVTTGSIVPLCFEKSMWTPVAMLAVLKCGAAFTLLEPTLPYSRLKHMVKQTESQLLLSSIPNKSIASELAPTIITVGKQMFDSPIHPAKKIVNCISPVPELMCVVFTSGSTGEPKGAKLTHSNFVSGLYYQVDTLKGFKSQSRVFDFASYSFDISIHNVFATLLTGGCLCIPSDDERKSGLPEAIARTKATTINLTTSVARLISPETVPELKVLILAGESVQAEDVSRWTSQSVQVVNAYGPAECGISTVNPDDSAPERLVSIGSGKGVVTWIVDPEDHEKLLGPGCTGELLLEGPLVSAGYLSAVGLASEAFLNREPSWLLKGHGTTPGRKGRLYKTGDMVRYDGEGRLIFLGRKDSQVKIRGQRTELGEIEAAVHSCFPVAPRVAADLVVLPEGSAPIIAAWIEGLQAQELTISNEMRMLLEGKLPSYMIPSTVIAIPEFPMTPSGKLDRERLRQLGTTHLLTQKDNQVNGDFSEDIITPNEETAYDLAQKITSPSGRNSPCGVTNGSRPSFTNKPLHFYGLDSVSFMSLRYHILKKFGVSVGMQLLLDRSTSIRSLAEYIQKSSGSNDKLHSGTSNGTTSRLHLWNDILQYEGEISQVVSAAQSCSSLEQFIQPSTLLVTGGSGYIGTQILRQAMESSSYETVITLARGDSQQGARDRVISAAKKARWWSGKYDSRLVVWKGDLAQVRLGLDVKHWHQLSSGHISAIVHNGAGVHFGKTYTDLKIVNVASTATLLSIVRQHSKTRFVHVTGGQASGYADGDEEQLAETLSGDGVIGYSQSKFVAEALVRREAARIDVGRITVVSPGLVVGTPTEGIANADDYLWRLTAGCIGVGSYDQDDAKSILKVADVGSVATTILDAVSSTKQHQEVPRTVVEVEGAMTRQHFWTLVQNMGYKLEAKPHSEWLLAIQEDLEQKQQKHPLWPVAHLLQSQENPANNDTQPTSNTVSPDIHCSSTTSLRVQKAIQKSAEFLASVGFLPDPTGARRAVDAERVEREAFTRSTI